VKSRSCSGSECSETSCLPMPSRSQGVGQVTCVIARRHMILAPPPSRNYRAYPSTRRFAEGGVFIISSHVLALHAINFVWVSRTVAGMMSNPEAPPLEEEQPQGPEYQSELRSQADDDARRKSSAGQMSLEEHLAGLWKVLGLGD